MEVPNLDEKINLLLRYDNIIKTRFKLAEVLGALILQISRNGLREMPMVKATIFQAIMCRI